MAESGAAPTVASTGEVPAVFAMQTGDGLRGGVWIDLHKRFVEARKRGVSLRPIRHFVELLDPGVSRSGRSGAEQVKQLDERNRRDVTNQDAVECLRGRAVIGPRRGSHFLSRRVSARGEENAVNRHAFPEERRARVPSATSPAATIANLCLVFNGPITPAAAD